MNTKAKRYVKKNDKEWADFNKVVRLYNSSTGKFLSLSDQEKEDFYSAVASINSKLSRMKKEEAQLWLKKVDVTEKIFSFLWQERNIAEPVELFELPSVKVEPVMGR
ncbi:hypothetical protein [Jiulongibacter sp. NS-SX5]|uniref:hypothetical protein n=1 Tax=Jiulongibacter sp. NS-SX5 TaxID=3463854 RepID=UPI0040581C1D